VQVTLKIGKVAKYWEIVVEILRCQVPRQGRIALAPPCHN